MSLTGDELLVGFSKFLNDYLASETTSAGASDGSTLVDTYLKRFGTDTLHDQFVRITETGSNAYAVRRIDVHDGSTATVLGVFPAQVVSASSYEIHRYDPAQKFRALDAARKEGFPSLSKLVYDDTLTGDGHNTDFPIPSTIRSGPSFAFIEEELAGDQSWNFLTSPNNDSLTGWTAQECTATLVSRVDSDLLIPKYTENCVKLATATATNGQFYQNASDMRNGLDAARAAGRKMTYAMWVYCLIPSRVSLKLQDNVATSTGALHQGRGWELLTVTRTIAPTNTTTITVWVDVSNASGAVTAYLNRGWLMFGDSVPDMFPESRARRVRRDDTTQRVYFDVDNPPPPNRNIRLIGQGLLSSLGDVAATQATNTMEVDEASADLLYAYAADKLFSWEGMVAENPNEIMDRIAITKAKGAELEKKFRIRLPAAQRLRGPWSGRAR